MQEKNLLRKELGMMGNSSYAYAEVLEVLDNMDDIYINKIPKKFIEYLKENANRNYEKHIVITKPLEEQNLNEKTLNILALINLKYWVESEEHKKELIEKYKENDRKKIEKLSKEFDSSSIFKNNENVNDSLNEEISKDKLPVERKNIFKRFIDFIKNKIFEN